MQPHLQADMSHDLEAMADGTVVRMPVSQPVLSATHAARIVEIEGAQGASPSPGVAAALAAADKVVIGPSNPAISIEPILAVAGHLLDPTKTLAVTPLVAGAALKGPTVETLRGTGREPTPTGIARG